MHRSQPILREGLNLNLRLGGQSCQRAHLLSGLYGGLHIAWCLIWLMGLLGSGRLINKVEGGGGRAFIQHKIWSKETNLPANLS
jgi:hypothetical protein